VSLALGIGSLVKVITASVTIAALAVLLPIRRIVGLDPATVFRGR
jgi:ABC-type lipoprotein release transport system permease subunit